MLFLLIALLVAPTSGQARGTPNRALELPSFTYPDSSRLLSPNGTVGTFRSDFCDASYRVLVTQEIPLERALEGWDLNVALLDSGELAKYQFDEHGNPLRLNPEYPGLMPVILDEICERAGCRWRNSFAYVSKDFPDKYSFTDLLLWTAEVYDVSINYWSRSIDRLQAGATFAESWYDGSIIMVAPETEPSLDTFDPWGWLTPFDSAVWFMVLLTMGFSCGVHWLIEVVFSTDERPADTIGESDEIHQPPNLWERLQPWGTLWRFATAFTGQFEFEPTTGPAYLFTFSVAFWALLMGAAYTANLASFLVIRRHVTIPINSIEEAIQQDQRMCVSKGTQQDFSVSNSYPVYARGGRLIRIQGGERKVFQALDEGLCDVVVTEAQAWNIYQRDIEVNGDCSLNWVGRALESIPASFSFKSDAGNLCTSLVRDVFNVHLIQMKSEGVIDDLWNRHIDRTATIDCAARDDDEKETSNGRRQRRKRRKLQSRKPRRSEGEKYVDAGELDPSFSSFGRLLRGVVGRRGAAGAAALAVERGDETEKLSLTNMGGVFLLHGILSTVAVLYAAGSWAWKRGYFARMLGPAFHPNATGEKEISTSTPTTLMTSSNQYERRVHQPFVDGQESSHSGTSNLEHHHQNKQKEIDVNIKKLDLEHELMSNVDALREEVNEKFSAVEERLTARLKHIEETLFASLDELMDYRQVLLDGNEGCWDNASFRSVRSGRPISK